MENELIQKALELNMEVTGLETADEVINIMKEVGNIKIPEVLKKYFNNSDTLI